MSWNDLPETTRTTATKVLTPKQLAVLKDRTNGHSWRTIATAYGTNEASVRGLHRRAVDRINKTRKDAA